MLDLTNYKIEVIEGVNDDPTPPNYLLNGRGPNGSYFTAKYNSLVSLLEDQLVSPPPQVSSDWESEEEPARILNKPTLGTASAQDVGYFATAAQGSLAVSALQPSAIGVSVQPFSHNTVIDPAYVRTDNNYSDEEKAKLAEIEPLTGAKADWNASSGPTQIVNKPYLGSASVRSQNFFATAAQGSLAVSALQPSAIGISLQPYNPYTVVDSLYQRTDNNYTNEEKAKLAGIAPGAQVNVNSDWNASSGSAQILNKPLLGTAAGESIESFATAAQGALASSALQPGDISPPIPQVNSDWNASSGLAQILNKPILGTAASQDVGYFATAAQGSLAASALQPGDISAPIPQVNSDWSASSGLAQILNKPSLGTASAQDVGYFATAAQGGLADSAVQPAAIANFETTTQLNTRDTNNRARANHTGTQAISTVNGLQDALDSMGDAGTKVITAVVASEVNCSLGSYFTKVVNENITFTFSNAPNEVAYEFLLRLEYISGSVTWPASVVWDNNTNPTLSGGITYLFYFVTENGGTKWRARRIIRDYSDFKVFLAVSHETTPFISIYRFDSSTDSAFRVADPTGGLPANRGQDTSFSNNGEYLAIAHWTSPFITIYKRTGDAFAKLSNPTGGLPAGSGNGVSFSDNGVYLAVAHDTSPFITIYKRTGDAFAKLSNPTGGLPAGIGYGVSFSDNGVYLAVAHATSPFITIYKRTGDTFTKLSNPTGGLPAGSGNGVSWSSDGTFLAVAHATSPFITIYKRTGDTFTKLSDPTGGLPADDANGVSFSNDTVYLAVSHFTSPRITIYKRDGDSFNKLADPTGGLPTLTGNDVAWSGNSTYLAVAHQNSPYISMYKREEEDFAKLSNPTGGLPSGHGRGASWYFPLDT